VPENPLLEEAFPVLEEWPLLEEVLLEDPLPNQEAMTKDTLPEESLPNQEAMPKEPPEGLLRCWQQCPRWMV